MRQLGHEIIAGFFVLGALVGTPWGITRYERSLVERPNVRVIRLTGVMKDGVWTDEEVDGLSYWRKTYRPAAITLREGEEVVLRLNSADVVHGFYAPELGVGPVEVEPGHVVEVRVRGERAGEFMYYCTAVCGRCHYFMYGTIRVLPARGPSTAAAATPSLCLHPKPPPAFHSTADRGHYLFRTKGCITCHGEGGRGGIRNPNYIKDTVSALNVLAERMGLFEQEDLEIAIHLLESRTTLEALEEDPPFRNYPRFLAQYNSIRNLIRNGNPAGKKDSAGPAPPLNMPSWANELNGEEIDAILVYLLTQYSWEEQE